MAVEVIDLCSSPEPDESPRKQAEGALAGFLPRKDKAKSKLAGIDRSSNRSNGYSGTNGHWESRKPSSPPLPRTDCTGDGLDPHDNTFVNSTVDIEKREISRKSTSIGERWQVGRHVGQDQQTSQSHAQNGVVRSQLHSPKASAGGEYPQPKQANEVVDISDEDEDDTPHNGSNGMGRQHGIKVEETLRSFRIDKSKRYPQDKVARPNATRKSFGVQDAMAIDSAPELASRPASSETLLNSVLSRPTDKLLEKHVANANDTGSTAVLSGAGLEVVRVQENTNLRPFPRLVENGTKRAANTPGEHEAKRPRMDEHTRDSRPDIVLVDVTDPNTERISHSDEPDIPKSMIRSPKTSLTTKLASASTVRKRADFSKGPNKKGQNYSPKEDELLFQLKEDGLNWDQITTYFNGRTIGSLQVRYSSRVARRDDAGRRSNTKAECGKTKLPLPSLDCADSSDNMASGRPKRSRNTAPSALDGFVSWASIKTSRKESDAPVKEAIDVSPEPVVPETLPRQDRSFPTSLSQILRRRELGPSSRRAWSSSSPRKVVEETKNHVYGDFALQAQYHGTSGDVVALSWAPDGDRFAAGSIAISDNRSMQYNMQRNLLVGARQRGRLREILDHHVPRPLIDASELDNVNGLHAMRASQDSRLFKTVTAAAFSPSSSKKLYTTGEDMMLRHYTVGKDLKAVKCRYEIQHPARVDLLAVSSPNGIVATGCHTDTESVHLHRFHEGKYEAGSVFSPTRRDLQSAVSIYPSTLKWGLAHQHSALLLAGFCGDQEKEVAGETCLWNIEAGTAIPLRSATRNVFDVAWNPNPSPASITFAVASNAYSLNVGRGTRSAIQCFAPNQSEARTILIWECPAPDINDVLFCPYDDNLIAAGATNGTVYVWDRRSASKSQEPLHVLQHGESENIIAHDKDPETADTGVRFLSWGATKTRLYSGSHDGIVKVWNPYRSPNNAHVDDIAPSMREISAVMSGAFSEDHRELLVGTENGRINLFSIEGSAVYKARKFELEDAHKPEEETNPLATARSMIDSGEIETRPCGAMPFQQAVQGPNYNGPFLAPTPSETRRAEERHQQALIAQSDAHLQKAQADLDDDDDDSKTIKADGEVIAAQHALDDIQERLEHFSFAQPKAVKFQQSLLKMEAERARLVARSSARMDPCDLHCTVLPNSDELEISSRSALRIPQVLRSMEQNAALSAIPEEESIRSCTSCFPLNARGGNRSLCAACKLKKAALTASCARCSGPARLQTDTTNDTLCERCSFACFRCDEPASIDDDMTFVSCASCQLTWEVGVLGYNLVTAPERRQRPAGKEHEATEQYDDFGDQEREHYASLWQDRDADEMMGF